MASIEDKFGGNGAAGGAAAPAKDEEQRSFESGPLSVLLSAVKGNEQVLISVRNNHKLLARIKAFDRHFNMVLEEVTEMWEDKPKGPKGPSVPKERVIAKMFLRGDNVVLVLRNPGA